MSTWWSVLVSPAIKVHDCGCQWDVHVAMALFTLGYVAQADLSVLLAHHPFSSYYDHPHPSEANGQ